MAAVERAGDDPKHVNVTSETLSSRGLVQTNRKEPCAPEADAFAVPCLIPSFAAASELLSAPYSCLVLNTHHRHVVLPPMYLHKKRTGIRGELETELLRFSQKLNGVLLAYDNIRIVGEKGDIYDDSSYIHMDIQADFIVFQPTKGQKLLGKVNKLGISHVGCLVHGCFNASIPKPNLVSVETWRVAGPRIGSELEFEVMALDADNVGVLLIRGRLDKTRVQELIAMEENSQMCVSTEQPEAADTDSKPEPTQDQDQEPPEETIKKRKKAKVKDEEKENDASPSSQPEGADTSQPNGTIDEEMANIEGKKKKKKKKEKCVKEEEEEAEVTALDVHGSDSSGYISDKPSKKRKHENGSDATSQVAEESETPKSKKKKRKSVIEQAA